MHSESPWTRNVPARQQEKNQSIFFSNYPPISLCCFSYHKDSTMLGDDGSIEISEEEGNVINLVDDARITSRLLVVRNGDALRNMMNIDIDGENFESFTLARTFLCTHRLPIPFSDIWKWYTLGFLNGWKNTAEKLRYEASTFSLISALFLACLIPLFNTPPDFCLHEDAREECMPNLRAETLTKAYFLSVFLAFLCALGNILLTAFLIAQTNLCPFEDDYREWIFKFGHIQAVAFVMFLASVVFVTTSVCLSVTASSWACGAKICAYLGAALLLTCLVLFILSHNLHTLRRLQRYNMVLNSMLRRQEVQDRANELVNQVSVPHEHHH
jgi:hypothetical protein